MAALEPLKLKLQVAVGCQVALGSEPESSARRVLVLSTIGHLSGGRATTPKTTPKNKNK